MPPPTEAIRTVAIAGLGLIGGSFALAMRQAGFAGRILGVTDPPYSDFALERGAVEEVVSLAQAAEAADLLLLSQPVDEILLTLEQLADLVHPEILVTDVGSTKRRILERAATTVGRRAFFLGGHPMAGKEQRGIQAADANLFAGRRWALAGIPEKPVLQTAVGAAFLDWLVRIGAQPVYTNALDHDRAVALTSHLPQLVSTALALAASHSPLSLFGPGLLDMTRLAASSPDLWGCILDTNGDEIKGALAMFHTALGQLETQIGAPELRRLFEQAGEISRDLRRQSGL